MLSVSEEREGHRIASRDLEGWFCAFTQERPARALLRPAGTNRKLCKHLHDHGDQTSRELEDLQTLSQAPPQ